MDEWVCQITGADSVTGREHIQTLWSGYGEIVRLTLRGATVPSVVVKHVEPGRGGGLSHQRKLRSYAVEKAWYADLSKRCDETCRVPRCLSAQDTSAGWRFLLEDLDAAGFSARREAFRGTEIDHALAWLANFHATFLGETPVGLWKTGTYWHLQTRPDELDVITDPVLRGMATHIDERLNTCAHQTFVHGDAKPANFCLHPDGAALAAVDFQYVGGGCGMKDLAYLLFAGRGWGRGEPEVESRLDAYFTHLGAALEARGGPIDGQTVEREWRPLYPLARADFLRFLAGWSPSRASLEAYRRAVSDLGVASP